MKILTTDNNYYNLDKIPEDGEDIQYCVLDTTNSKNIDFFFIPLIFMETFNACLLYTSQSPRDSIRSRNPSKE